MRDQETQWQCSPNGVYGVQTYIFGYELKDLATGCIHWTWLVHHGVTFFGRVYVLLMPQALGSAQQSTLNTLLNIVVQVGDDQWDCC